MVSKVTELTYCLAIMFTCFVVEALKHKFEEKDAASPQHAEPKAGRVRKNRNLGINPAAGEAENVRAD